MNESKKLPLWPALTGYLIGFLWVCCFLTGFWEPAWDGRITHGYPLYPLLFCAVFFPWAGFSLAGKKAPREHIFWLVCALLIALAIACKRSRAAGFWAYFALHGLAAYWVVCRSGLLTEGESGVALLPDLLNALIVFPFGGFFLRSGTVFSRLMNAVGSRRCADPGSRKNLLISLLIILCALPFLILAGSLLGQADESFRQLLSGMIGFLTYPQGVPRWAEEVGYRFRLGLPVGAYLFGLVGTCLRRTEPVRHAPGSLRFAPSAALIAVFCGFCGLYLLFFVVQAGHLLGAFFGSVPGTLTAAQYAREGFFQLCLVMAVNFGLLFAASAISRTPLTEHRGLRRCADVLMAQSILLAVTAAGRLGLYIRRFGFTPLRLLSMWGILVLTAGCVFSLWHLHGGRKAMKSWLFFTAATFTALCFY